MALAIKEVSINEVWAINLNNSEIIIKFSKDYPLISPFVRIAKTNLKFDNSSELNILTNGAILLNQMCPKYWNVGQKIADNLKIIIKYLKTCDQSNDRTYDEHVAFDEYCTKIKELNLI